VALVRLKSDLLSFLGGILNIIDAHARSTPRRHRQSPELTSLEGRQLLSLSPTDIVVNAVPRFLSPPNGQYIPVTVSGSFNESATNAEPTGFFYVTDQYGKLEPRAFIPLHQSATDPKTFTYSFTIELQAQRGSMTSNGRQYNILVGARDGAGAVGKTIAVAVPKDPIPQPHHGPKAAVHAHGHGY
jgi:hypothetical protein